MGRSDLSPRTILDPYLNLLCLIDPIVELNLIYDLDSFFESFTFYLFESFTFYPMISNCHLNSNLIFILSMVLIFTNECQKCAKYTPQSNGLVLIACHASSSCQKPNLGSSTTYNHESNLKTFQSK